MRQISFQGLINECRYLCSTLVIEKIVKIERYAFDEAEEIVFDFTLACSDGGIYHAILTRTQINKIGDNVNRYIRIDKDLSLLVPNGVSKIFKLLLLDISLEATSWHLDENLVGPKFENCPRV